MINTQLKKLDGTLILEAYADSNLRSPATGQRRHGKVFNTPSGPFVQYADEVAVGVDVVELYWRLVTAVQEDILFQASRGVFGDELYLLTPYEAQFKVAFVPGPEAHESQRFKGTPPDELRRVTSRLIRLE